VRAGDFSDSDPMHSTFAPLVDLLRRNNVQMPMASSSMVSELLSQSPYAASVGNDAGRNVVKLLYGAKLTADSLPRRALLEIIPYASGQDVADAGVFAAQMAAELTQMRFSCVGRYLPRVPQSQISTRFGEGEIASLVLIDDSGCWYLWADEMLRFVACDTDDALVSLLVEPGNGLASICAASDLVPDGGRRWSSP
jgi:hypothetical protein